MSTTYPPSSSRIGNAGASRAPHRLPRVALLTNMPSPYVLGFFNKLAGGCDLHVVFDALSEPNRQWTLQPDRMQFAYSIARGWTVPYARRALVPGEKRDTRYLQLRWDVVPRLRALKPDVVAAFEMGPRSLQAALYCLATRTPLLLRWEGTRHTEGWVGPGKQVARRFLVKVARRFWSNGSESSSLLMDYGAPARAIDSAMMGADVDYFIGQAAGMQRQRSAIRDELGLGGAVLLYVGRYVEAKGLRQYLQALHALCQESTTDLSAIFVGDGPMASELRAFAADHPGRRILVEGFVQQEAISRFHAAADAFVLPTLEDNWSIASLEALAAGLPQLFSVYNGATSDLLADPRIGRVADPLQPGSMERQLREMVTGGLPRVPAELIESAISERRPTAIADRALRSIQTILD